MASLRRIVGEPEFTPVAYQDIVSRLLVTAYLGTKNSSSDTLSRAQRLAKSIGSLHYDLNIDTAYDSIFGIFAQATGKSPQF